MPKKIKLENIIAKKKPHHHEVKPTDIFCPECGEDLRREEVITEYVCENCRHLVGKDDKFCWRCGVKLESSNLVEHYHRGEKLTNKEFGERRELFTL